MLVCGARGEGQIGLIQWSTTSNEAKTRFNSEGDAIRELYTKTMSAGFYPIGLSAGLILLYR